MELFEQSTLQLPVGCCLLSDEEMTYAFGGAQQDVDAQAVLQTIAGTIGTITMNLIYYFGSAVFSQVINGVEAGYKDGLSLPQTFSVFWGRQTPASKAASVVMASLAGYYIGVQVYSLYQSLVNLFAPSQQAQPAAA